MLIQNGMGVKPRDLNVEYSGYVALALGIGVHFHKTSPCRAPWWVKRIATEINKH